MELINSVNIDALYALASKLIVLVGVMAFLVSVVTQVLKQIPGLEKRVPDTDHSDRDEHDPLSGSNGSNGGLLQRTD